MKILCDNPRIIINPNLPNLLLRYRRYYLKGKPYKCLGRQITTYNDTYRHVFSVKRNHITREDVDDCYVLCEKTGETFPIYIEVPCGSCPNCIKSRQNTQVYRAKLETFDHLVKPWFVTLTYDDEHLPLIWFPIWNEEDCLYDEHCTSTLSIEDVQKFLKRLRINLERKYAQQHGYKIRYSCVGEYGKNTRRPHYHLIIWNLRCYNHTDFLAVNQIVHDSWQKGFTYTRIIDPVKDGGKTFRYTTKYLHKSPDKQKLPHAVEPYYNKTIIEGFRAPFHTSSNRGGGIGTPYLRKHAKELSHTYAYTLNPFSQFTEPVQFNSHVISVLFPSYARLVPSEYRNAVRDLLYFDAWETPQEPRLIKEILDEFRDSLTFIPNKEQIPMKHSKLRFSSAEECVEYIKKHRASARYVAPSEAAAMQLKRDIFLMHNFGYTDITEEQVKQRSYDAVVSFNRQFTNELL